MSLKGEAEKKLVKYFKFNMKNETIFHERKKSNLKAYALENVTSLTFMNIYKLRNNIKTEYITKREIFKKINGYSARNGVGCKRICENARQLRKTLSGMRVIFTTLRLVKFPHCLYGH